MRRFSVLARKLTMSVGKSVTLSTGAPLPQIGFGTWQSSPGDVERAVRILNHEACY